jgi:hypothetical protein
MANSSLKHIRNYEVNPSIKELREVLRYNPRYVEGEINAKYVDDNLQTIIVKGAGHYEDRFHDNEKFIKTYTASFKELRSLSSVASDMYYFIADILSKKVGVDRVAVSKSEFFKYSGKKSDVSYYKALKELLVKNFIYRIIGEDSIFFINVRYFYNGNRGNLYAKHYGYDLSDDTPNPEWVELNKVLKGKNEVK